MAIWTRQHRVAGLVHHTDAYHRRLHGQIGMIPPVEKETHYYARTQPLTAAGSQ